MISKDNTGKLYAHTKYLLVHRPRDILLKDLAKEIGVSQQWFTDFLNGRNKHPSVNVIERLYEKLSGETLKLGE